MKKILFMLTAAMLTLTACQQRESFDFLVGETNIGVVFDYTKADYENANVQAQFDKIFDAKHDAWERAFVEEVNDEIEDVLMSAYQLTPDLTVQPSNINYTFMIDIKEVTEYGILSATIRVLDNEGRTQNTFEIKARKEFDSGFVSRILDSMEDLGERLGENIRYGV